MDNLSMNQGQLHLIFGPMWAWKKSTLGEPSTLYRLYKRYSIINKKILLIKSTIDTRYSTNEISIHDMIKIPSISIKSEELNNLDINDYDVYLIDEGHFFDPVIIKNFCEKGIFKKKHIIISLLNGNYKLEPIPVLNLLLPMSTSSEHFNTICMKCKEKFAYYTIRKTEEKETEEKDNFIIGSDDKYLCVCTICHPKYNEYYNI